MRRIDKLSDPVLGLAGSSIDSNRFYSILLDARAATASESLYDISEKLLSGEKENAKAALDQLWILKKNMFNESNSGTVNLLINYYQEKMDILRNKEENIKKISRDSRTLFEEKRKRDEEIANVKQQIGDCSRELTDLNSKLEKLKIKEQELSLIEEQLKRELHGNENEIVNGLYEIILTQHDDNPLSSAAQLEIRDAVKEAVLEKNQEEPVVKEQVTAPKDEAVESKPEPEPKDEMKEYPSKQDFFDDTKTMPVQVETAPALKNEIPPETAPFPKSVVKTTRGRVIGEYFYDGKVYKNERHYIFNSKFFSEQLSAGMTILRSHFDSMVYAEIVQMIQDAHKRITENNHLHFEISVNEILNEKSLKQLLQDIKLRTFDEVERLASRLKAKIEALGSNYRVMLSEQMDRCTQK